MRRRRQHHFIAWAVLWAVVGALIAIAGEAHGQAQCGDNGNQQPNFSGQISVTFGSSIANGRDVSFTVTVPGLYSAQWHAVKGTDTVARLYSGPANFSNPCSGSGTASVPSGHADGDASVPISGSATLTFINAGHSYLGGWVDYPFPLSLQIGTGFGCTSDVHVTAHWAHAPAKFAAGVVVDFEVGGIFAQVQCNAFGCATATIPYGQLNALGSAPYNVNTVGIAANSWTQEWVGGTGGHIVTQAPTISGTVPNSLACGGTLDVGLDANLPLPTPTPSPTATVSPSASPGLTPQPTPSTPPIDYATPPPNNPGTTVTNGGTTMSGITNQDIYNDVKQALDDAGNRDSNFVGVNGGFGFGSDPAGESGAAGSGLQSAVDRFTGDLSGTSDGLMGAIDSIDSLTLPTSIGDKSSWALSLPVLGEINVDLSTFDTPVHAFRALCLGVLIVGGWFAMIKIIRSGVA
jgi:hypothetical protein